MSNCPSCGGLRRPAKTAWGKAVDALNALAAGKMPTQKQINTALNSLMSSDLFKVGNTATGTLGAQGQSLVLDIKAILEAIIRIGMEKNADDLLQDVIWEDRLTGIVNVHPLLSLLFTSSAFRLLLADILITTWQILAATTFEIAEMGAYVEARAGGADVEHALNGPGLRKPVSEERLAEESLGGVKQTILERVEAIVRQVQGNPAFQASLEILVILCEKYFNLATQATGSAANNSTAQPPASIDPAIETDQHLKQLLGDLRILLERFAGGYSLSSLSDSMKQFLAHLSQDETSRVSDLLRDAKIWLRKALETSGWLTTRAARQELDELYDRTKHILNAKLLWREDLQNVLAEASSFFHHLKQDTATQQLLGAIDALSADIRVLGEESASWRKVRTDLWRDAVGWFLPRLLAILEVVPLPQVKLQNEALDLVVDDVTFRGPSSIPDHTRVEGSNPEVEGDSGGGGWAVEGDSVLRVHIDSLRITAHRMAYVFRYESAWLNYQDDGLLCIDIGHESAEEGLTLDVELETDLDPSTHTADSGAPPPAFFRVRTPVVNVPVLDFNLADTYHWFINACVQPFLRPIVRARVGDAISQSIKDGLEMVDRKLGEVYARAKEEASAKIQKDGTSSEPGIWDWWNALLKSQSEDSRDKQEEEKETPEPQTETQVTAKKVTHIAKRMKERRNVEQDREGWKSEVFDI